MTFRQRVAYLLNLAAVVFFCIWIFRVLYGIAVGIYTGHAHEALMPWIYALAYGAVAEFLYYLYLNYYPSTFSDHRRIDEPAPEEPPTVERLALKVKKTFQVIFAITVVFMIVLNTVESLTGKIGWHVAFAVWVLVLAGFITWLLILEFYIRYASSIFSERNVIPVPFRRRRT